jgi:hypothetical protein
MRPQAGQQHSDRLANPLAAACTMIAWSSSDM